jgi:hypothetical protein
MPDDPGAPAEAKPDPLAGLTRVQAELPARVPIRVREKGNTLSGWRLALVCDQGAGAIVLAEVGPGEAHYRGEGVLLGWSGERLAGAYAALLPQVDEPTDLIQLG